MRLAAVAVGSAMLGSSVVLFAVAPAVPAGEVEVGEITVGTPAAEPASAPGAPACPPCSGVPLDPDAWREKLAGSTPPPAATWNRATVLSLALPDGAAIERALADPDPAARELAALLLNVGSDRIVGCTPIRPGGATASDLLDALDRLVAATRAGEPVAARDLTAATEAARALNEGRPGAGTCLAAPSTAEEAAGNPSADRGGT